MHVPTCECIPLPLAVRSRLNDSAVKPWSVAHFIDVAALAAVASLLPPPREPDGCAPRVWSPDPMVGTVLHKL